MSEELEGTEETGLSVEARKEFENEAIIGALDRIKDMDPVLGNLLAREIMMVAGILYAKDEDVFEKKREFDAFIERLFRRLVVL
jgi:hypothetical protein